MDTLEKRLQNDILSDNTNTDICEQCKKCLLQSDGTPWSNKYNKLHCQAYQKPLRKPEEVVSNLGKCEYRKI